MENNYSVVSHRKKTSSIVSHIGGKYLPLWDTTEENLRRFGIQCRRFFWDTAHRIRSCCGVGYNGRKTSALWDTTEKNLLAILRLFSVISHNGKNLFRCIPQMDENLLHLIPTMEKNSSVVSHNRKNRFRCIPQRQKKRKT
jgi:hypothetical protein